MTRHYWQPKRSTWTIGDEAVCLCGLRVRRVSGSTIRLEALDAAGAWSAWRPSESPCPRPSPVVKRGAS